MKHTKRILTALLMVLLCAAFAAAVSAEDATIVDSGYCGGEGDGMNLTWTLDSEGTLTISGEGAMDRYTSSNTSPTHLPPWERYNDSLKEIRILDGVTTFSSDWFAYFSTSLIQQVIIPASITNLSSSDNSLSGDFFYCSNIAFFEIDENNSVYSSDENGCIFNKDKSILLHFPCKSELKEYRIPNSVKRIAWHAFTGVGLEKLIIPESVEHIDDSAIWSNQYLNECYVLNPNCELQGYWLITYSNTELYGYEGSTLQAFAQSGIDNYGPYIFIPLCSHAYEKRIDEQFATCVSVGYTAGTFCPDCETWISGHEELPINPNAHATLDENGDCPRCGKHVKDVEKTEKLNFFQRIIQWFRNLFARLFKR